MNTHQEPVQTESDPALRTRALESLLIEKGLLTADLIDKVVHKYEKDVGPLNGARVVARAWIDADYKRRLLEDGTAAIAELGFGGTHGARMVVLENTSTVHHVVVCTLCSCYPWPVLGLPPGWYKILRVPFTGRPRTPSRFTGVRSASARLRRNPRLGQQLGSPLHGPAGTSCRHRGLHRRGAYLPRHTRLDDRCGQN